MNRAGHGRERHLNGTGTPVVYSFIGQAEDQRREIVARSVISRTLSPRNQTIAARIGALEEVGHAGRRRPGNVAVVEDEIDELRERVPRLEVRSGGNPLQRQRGVGRRAQGHEPLDLQAADPARAPGCIAGRMQRGLIPWAAGSTP